MADQLSLDTIPAATDPNMTVTVGSDTWLKILRCEMDATMAFMTGTRKIAGGMGDMGDMGVMLRFQGRFDQPT